MLKRNEFYCVKCRKRMTCKNEDMCVKIYKNKKTGETPALRGVCSKCGTNLTKFVKRDDVGHLIEKYGKC